MVTRYCDENDAKDAVRKLHNYRIRFIIDINNFAGVSELILYCVNRPDFPLAVTISVDNRRLVARLVPAGTRTEAEVPTFESYIFHSTWDKFC